MISATSIVACLVAVVASHLGGANALPNVAVASSPPDWPSAVRYSGTQNSTVIAVVNGKPNPVVPTVGPFSAWSVCDATTPAAQQRRLEMSLPVVGTTVTINTSVVASCPLKTTFVETGVSPFRSCLASPLNATVVVGWCAHHSRCNRLHRTLTDHHRRLGTGLSHARNVATPGMSHLRPPRLSARRGAGATMWCGGRRQSSGHPLAANPAWLRTTGSSQPFRCAERRSDALLDLSCSLPWRVAAPRPTPD